MITFRDGPAAGVVLQLKRAPLLLRVVRSKRGEWDALDQLDDEPATDETITVYRIHPETVSRYHLLCRGRGRGGKGDATGWWMKAEYSLFGEQPDDDEARSTEAWREWATKRAELISRECEELAAARTETGGRRG